MRMQKKINYQVEKTTSKNSLLNILFFVKSKRACTPLGLWIISSSKKKRFRISETLSFDNKTNPKVNNMAMLWNERLFSIIMMLSFEFARIPRHRDKRVNSEKKIGDEDEQKLININGNKRLFSNYLQLNTGYLFY